MANKEGCLCNVVCELLGHAVQVVEGVMNLSPPVKSLGAARVLAGHREGARVFPGTHRSGLKVG